MRPQVRLEPATIKKTSKKSSDSSGGGNGLWKLLTLFLVLAGVAGLAFPKWKEARQTSRSAEDVRQIRVALEESLAQQQWRQPWLSLDNGGFEMGWLQLETLGVAQALDEAVDDGNPVTGKLTLAPKGVVWSE